jgi:hypothetical protein
MGWGRGVKTTENKNIGPILPCFDTVESEGRHLNGVDTKCSRTQRKRHRTSTLLIVADQSATVQNVAFTNCKHHITSNILKQKLSQNVKYSKVHFVKPL